MGTATAPSDSRLPTVDKGGSRPTLQQRRGWVRFRRNHLAIISAWFLVWCLLSIAVAMPFAVSWFDVQDLEQAVRHPPTATPIGTQAAFAEQLRENPVGAWFRWAESAAYRVSGWMGYDALGRSLWYRAMLGWLVRLGIGLAAATIAVTFGTFWGAAAALVGGGTDTLMMRVVDVLYGLPYVLLVILLKVGLEEPLRSLLGNRAELANIVILFVAIGSVSWLTPARVVRGQVLSLTRQAFVEAARAGGAGNLRILWRHLLPNVVGPVLVCATLVVPQAILQESFLSFLGIGVRAPMPSLGRLAADGVQAVNTFVGFWWLITFPCVILVATLVALNFVGDGLRDAFDPKSSVAPMV